MLPKNIVILDQAGRLVTGCAFALLVSGCFPPSASDVRSSAHAAEPAPARSGFLLSGEVNSQGTPVVAMWGSGKARAGVEGSGYPILKSARHALIFQDAVEAGAYNHHPQLACQGGVFFAAWSNHPKGEDAAGQRVLFSISPDGAGWRKWAEAFPPPSEVRGWEDGFGYYSVAAPWHVHDGKVYLTARIYNFVGWENSDRTSRAPARDSEHIFQRYEYLGILAREVTPQGELGPVFSLSTRMNRAKDLAYAFIPYGDPAYQPIADSINRVSETTPRFKGPLPVPVDTARLVEPTVYEAGDKSWVAVIRDDKFSHRKYVSFSRDCGTTWSKAMPTDIPDSPSLDVNVSAPDGSILLIGNHCAAAFDNPQSPNHYDRDTLDVAVSSDGYDFPRTYALRTGVQAWRVPRQAVRGRGGGPQYPSALVAGDRLYVMYSFGKEDIWCSSVPLSDLLLPPSNSPKSN
ncbi:MAG: hypothetical protein BGO12_03250 [Verrucomicrobia bacterium 61-8]|nr:MAG: hypothetical protein BGO12_03250 [Verrucomicrobia bacterium 61-8]